MLKPLMKTRALLVSAQEQITLGEVEIPAPAADEVLVQTELSAISPGSEIRCYLGQEEGSDQHPFIPGYSCLGRVVERGRACTIPLGTRVFVGTTSTASARRLWGGHIAHAVAAENRVIPIPEAIDPLAAVLLKLAAIAHRGFALAPSQPGQTVAVLGLGPIGLLSALIHQAHGSRVVGLDLIPQRLLAAHQLGLAAASPETATARDLLPAGADTVVDSTGAPAALRSALDWLSELPWDQEQNLTRTLVLQGSYGSRDIQLPYVGAFFKELRLVVPRDELPGDKHAVLELLAAEKLRPAAMISRVVPPENAEIVYHALRDRDPTLITAAFRWS
jgi:2-desacetyl-2-hydroxyethyl bacteriochlorophyllide A dehydrogenase